MEQWTELVDKKIEKSNNNKKEKYILCYFLSEKQFYWEYVKKVAEKTNCKVKIIPMTRKAYFKNMIWK